MKKLFLIPIFIVFLISLANAQVIMTYNFQDQDGNKLDNVDFLAYICNDAQCESVTPHASGNTNANLPHSSINVWYPTNLPTQYGYALYAFKDGYLSKEALKKVYGNGEASETVILEKKSYCSAPIDHIEVLNDVRPNIPLVIDVSASLDADTYSAFHSNSNTPAYVPEQFKDFYSAETKITLNIYKKSNPLTPIDTIYEVSKIFMDSSKAVQFTWTPSEEDDYLIKISTEVIDNKCSSTKTNTATAEFKVYEDVPQDACYTILNRPGTSNPIDAEVGEQITITGDKSSYYIDNYQNTVSVDSQVTLKIYKDSSIKMYKDSNLYIEDYLVYEETKDSFSFTWTPTQSGDYTIKVEGIATDSKCDGIDNYPSQILTIPLTVYPKTPLPDETLELKFITNQVINEGETLTFDVMPYNYKGSYDLAFTAENLPEGATFEPIWVQTWFDYKIIGYRFTWTPNYDTVSHQTNFIDSIKRFITNYFTDGKQCRDDGKCEFKVLFKASAGNLNDQQEIIISVKDVNRIPHVLNQIGPIIVTEGDLVKIVPTESFTDLDFDKLTYSYTAPLNENGEWQTKIGDAGEYLSEITASDGMAAAMQDILIVVRAAPITENHAPEFIYIPDKTVYVNQELKFTIEATDEDNDVLAYSASVIPPTSTFQNQEFSWVPAQAGDYVTVFRVEDQKGGQDIIMVKIKVIEEPIEITLNLNEIPSQEIKLGESIQPISVTAEYNGEDELTYSVENLPEGSLFENQIFTWTPKQIGVYNIIFKVTDGTLTDTETAVITVTEEAKAIRATKHNIGIQRIIVNNMDKVTPGEYFPTTVYAKNLAGLKEKDVRITASIPELKQVGYSQSFDLNTKQSKAETFMFRLPVNTDTKEYVLAVTVSNNKDKETKYVSIKVE